MDYNQIITNNFPPLIERLIRMVDRYSEFYKLSDIKISIDDSDLSDLGNYVSTQSTCEFRIDINYLLEGEEEYRYFYVTVPRMINGLFILNGKYKMLSRYLSEDHECRRIGRYFRISYHFSYDIEDELFSYKDEEADRDDDFELLTFEELALKYPHMLTLSEHQSNKLKIKLDLETAPKKLTKEIVERFKDISDNQNDIVDKRIKSIDSILFDTFRTNLMTMVNQLKHNYYNHGTLSPSPIQNIINGAFNGQMSSVNPLINSANVNPLSFDSTNEKIIIDNESYQDLHPGNYDVTMADIIDPVVTPDNANINRINMLTKVAGVKDGYISIKCYDAKFNPIEVEYVKYLASIVLTSEEVTSYSDKIVPIKSVYKVKVNRKVKDASTYDYIEPAPDDRLSVEARMIPMINEVDSVRCSMGAKMIGQSVPLSTPEPPRVQSGYEGDNDLSTTDIKFESSEEGTVIKADFDSVIVMVNGIPKEYKVPTPAVGIYNITAAFSPKVKVGDVVKGGSTLITHDIAREGTRNIGLNALVALRPYRGLNYEDGIVISESFARRLNHYSIIDLTLMVNDDQTILSLAPIGTQVKSMNILVQCIASFRSEVNANLINMMTPSDKSLYRTNNLVVPNEVSDGIVTDVKIYYDDYVKESKGAIFNKLNSQSIEVLEEFKRKRSILPDNVPEAYRAKLPDGYEYEGHACCIRYRLLTTNPTKVGTKLCNRYGSKGLVAKVVPDKEMDRTTDGRVIEVILNSDAVIARKNIAQIPEVYLANIADAIRQRIKGMAIPEAKRILAKYKLYNYSKLPDQELQVVLNSNKPLNYITGCFSRITIEEILKWIDELKIEELTQIIDGKTGRPVRNKILVGQMYMMKLYQLPEFYNKVFTAESDSDPRLGQGFLREGAGMSQGNLETFALLASDLEPYIYKTRERTQFKDAEGVIINLRLAGVNIRVE